PPHAATLADDTPHVESGDDVSPVIFVRARRLFRLSFVLATGACSRPGGRLEADRAMLALRQALRDLRRRRVRSVLTMGGVATGVAALVLLGSLPETMSRLVAAGRLAAEPGSDEVVLGSQVARVYRAAVGDPITLRGRLFRVVGVLEPTLTGPDSFVFMSFPSAERLLIDSEPLLRRLVMVPG